MNKNKSDFSFLLLVLDVFLLNVSFLAMSFWKLGHLGLPPLYAKLLFGLHIIWIAVALSIRKFNKDSYRSFRDSIILFIKFGAYTVFITSFLVVIFGHSYFSRLQIYGTLFIFSLLETAIYCLWSIYNKRKDWRRVTQKTADAKEKTGYSIYLIFGDFYLFTFSFLAVYYVKRGTLDLTDRYEQLILVLYSVWLVTSLITGKLQKGNYRNFYYAVSPCVKASLLSMAVMSFVIFAFRLFYLSRMQTFGTLCLFFILEVPVFFIYFKYKAISKGGKDAETLDEIKALIRHSDESLEITGKEVTTPVNEKLQAALDFFNPWLFRFIDGCLDLKEIDRNDTAIISSNRIISVNTLDDNSLRLFINLHKVNDIRWINKYFLEVYNKLENGGYLVGSADTILLYKKKIYEKYPQKVATVFYGLHFLFFRVLPKLPVIKKIFLALSQGRARVLSKAEVLGRLYFCGFEVVTQTQIDNRLYYIARKSKLPSSDISPTYGPLIKLKRAGIDGQVFSFYKFRTMHPYSEYLQKYIYEHNSLETGGKIENDYRITEWGKIMRKLWVDELPMIYNWVKGDISLIGVRPLSTHYLSLYNDELKELRREVKPGLIPPYYADMPETFEEICDSELRYLEAYMKNPVEAQWTCFRKAFDNIVIKGARSR